MKELIKHNGITQLLNDLYLQYKTKDVDTYVFVATTGRSGSLSLTHLFSEVSDCISTHEPYPIMTNFEIEENAGKKLSIYKKKSIYIKRAAQNNRIYIETNHLFIKNFYDLILNSFNMDKLKLIHLIRPCCEVALSFYSINSIPGKSERGKNYLLSPSRADNEINIPELLDLEGEFSHDFYKCLWYWYEIESRTKKCKLLFPQVKWFELKTKELNDRKQIEKLCCFIGVNFEEVSTMVGVKKNLKKEEKINVVDFNAEDMSDNFKSLLISKGYSI
ncbi:MAG: hypothetical protein ACI93P_000739 [bacterium]